MLYAQGLLPALIPLSVLLFERTVKRRRRMLPFVILGIGLTLYMLWALAAFPTQVYVHSNSIVYINQATNYFWVAVLYVIATCGSLFFSENRDMVLFGAANLAILLITMAEALCVHVRVVRVCGGCERDHSGVLLAQPSTAAVQLRRISVIRRP